MLASDHAEVRQVYVDAVLNLSPRIYSQAQLDAWSAVALLPGVLDETLRSGYGLVSCNGETIEAFAVLHPVDRVALLYCRARYHRQGRGGQLLVSLEQEASRQGVKKLRSEASYISHPLFERMGWLTVEKEQLLIGGVSFERFRIAKSLA